MDHHISTGWWLYCRTEHDTLIAAHSICCSLDVQVNTISGTTNLFYFILFTILTLIWLWNNMVCITQFKQFIEWAAVLKGYEEIQWEPMPEGALMVLLDFIEVRGQNFNMMTSNQIGGERGYGGSKDNNNHCLRTDTSTKCS